MPNGENYEKERKTIMTYGYKKPKGKSNRSRRK